MSNSAYDPLEYLMFVAFLDSDIVSFWNQSPVIQVRKKEMKER